MVKKKGKQAKSQKKQWNGPTESKEPLLKYTNYHSLNAIIDQIYAVMDKNLFRKPEAIKSNRSRRDFKKNCAFHKDTGHSTERCMALKEEVERLIRAGHFQGVLG